MIPFCGHCPLSMLLYVYGVHKLQHTYTKIIFMQMQSIVLQLQSNESACQPNVLILERNDHATT
jgi:hypothetical protein